MILTYFINFELQSYIILFYIMQKRSKYCTEDQIFNNVL